jgi:hypothetical protein
MVEQESRRVDVQTAQIASVFIESSGSAVSVLFTISGFEMDSVDSSVKALADAADFAETVVPSDIVAHQRIDPTPYGPMIWLDYVDELEMLEAWLLAVARHLDDAGWSGQLTGHRGTWKPEWFRNRPQRRLPSAFLAPTFDSAGFYDSGVLNADEATSAARTPVGQLAGEWLSELGGLITIETGLDPMTYLGSELAGFLASACHYPIAAHALAGDPYRFREVRFMGDAYFIDEDVTAAWQTRAEEMTALLVGQAPNLDLGYVTNEVGWGHTWRIRILAEVPQPLHRSLNDSRHLWNRYLPDIRGIQLLTGAHLSRANNLADWNVTLVAPDRYLVKARELGPWFSTGEPDPDLVATARHDFDDALISYEHLTTEASTN